MSSPSTPVIRKPGEGAPSPSWATFTASWRLAKTPTASTPCGKPSCLRAAGLPCTSTAGKKKGFYILEGEITVQVGDERIVATAGMFANMPVGTPHSFKNESSRPARMLISVAPAGLEKMFFEFGVPLPEGSMTALPPTKEEIEKLLAVAPRYGIEIKLPQP